MLPNYNSAPSALIIVRLQCPLTTDKVQRLFIGDTVQTHTWASVIKYKTHLNIGEKVQKHTCTSVYYL